MTPLPLEAAYAKVTRRLIPFLFLCYITNYLDRVNLGFAKLQMSAALGLSDTAYGLGAGIFFIGYLLFQVPSNLLLHRLGARRWIGRIMIAWGLISAAMLLVRSTAGFCALRFLLGVAEAGFFPGIIYYLTQWYPAGRRARIVALFMSAIPLSSVVGGPLSGWILASLGRTGRMAGWQWLFLIEALPAVLLGLVALRYLDDGIDQAKWLGAGEKSLLRRQLETEAGAAPARSAAEAFRERRTWWSLPIYFAPCIGLYGVSFWLPTIIKSAGVDDAFLIGCLTALPWAVAAVAMIVTARNSDRSGERRWHLAIAGALAGIGLAAAAAFGGRLVPSLLALTVATAGICIVISIFWSLPTAFLSQAAAAAGIAFINSIGNLGGFLGPFLIGWIRDLTRSTGAGLCVLAGFAFIGALATLAFPLAKQTSLCPSPSSP